jgi:hypothetical protein
LHLSSMQAQSRSRKLRSCNPEREGLLHPDGQWAPFQRPSS